MRLHLLHFNLVLLFCFSALTTIAQLKLGDNATTLNSASILELESTNKGLVFPRLSLSATNASTPLPVSLLSGTVVYNTNASIVGGSGVGLYVWTGSAWSYLTALNTSGTTDYLTRWVTASSLGIGLIRDNNTSVGINTAPVSTEMLTLSGGASLNGLNVTSTRTTSGSYAIRGNITNNQNAYLGYVGTVTVAGTTATNPPAYFTTANNSSPGMVATSTNASTSYPAIEGLSAVGLGGYFATANSSADAIRAINTTSGGTILINVGSGLYALTGNRYGFGVWGENSNQNGSAIFAENSANNGSNGGNGLEATTGQNQGFAVFAYNDNSSGTAVFGAGNNATGSYLSAGSGGAFTGNGTGMFSLAKTTASGNGLVSVGNNGSITTLSGGSGGTLIGASTGAFGFATTSASGTGIIGLGNNGSTVGTLTSGSGGAFTGATTGAYGLATTVSNGTGVIGVGNNSGVSTLTTGSGGAFGGTTVGVYGRGADATAGNGVVAVGNGGSIGTLLSGGSGGSFFSSNVGTYSVATNAASGTGVIGVGNNGVSSLLSGGSGGAFSGLNTGSYSLSTSTTGTGVIGVGNNASTVTLAGGSGGAFSGTTSGAYGFASDATGTGIIGVGNNSTAQTDPNGSGGAFTGSTNGLYAHATSAAEGSGAIKTFNAATGGDVYVNYLSDGTLGTSGTAYKIIGVGSVSTIVKNEQNQYVALHAPEAPEILFEDYGQGRLVDGFAHISIDPVFSKNITVNDKHPLRVFIQLYGDCNGVFVSNATAAGFDVKELQKGHSNVPFMWHIVGNRADEMLSNGMVSRNADVRLEKVDFANRAKAAKSQRLDKNNSEISIPPTSQVIADLTIKRSDETLKTVDNGVLRESIPVRRSKKDKKSEVIQSSPSEKN
jgi:hypothetical protein